MQKDKSAKKNDKKNEEGKGQFAEESKSGRYFVPQQQPGNQAPPLFTNAPQPYADYPAYEQQPPQKSEAFEEDNQFLPIAVVEKIMRQTLTPCPKIMLQSMPDMAGGVLEPKQMTAKISKEAKETIQECLTEFILFLTSEAWEICEGFDRKTLIGSDLIQAMERLDFGHYSVILRKLLEKVKAVHKAKEVENYSRKHQKQREESKDSDDEPRVVKNRTPHNREVKALMAAEPYIANDFDPDVVTFSDDSNEIKDTGQQKEIPVANVKKKENEGEGVEKPPIPVDEVSCGSIWRT